MTARTVLLVSSSEDDCDMYAEFLKMNGIRSITADNGADALSLAPAADVIVTDSWFPGAFDGLELIRRLRAARATSGTPVIVLTAWTAEPVRDEAYRAGCDTFLEKPCAPDRLLSELRRLAAPPPRELTGQSI